MKLRHWLISIVLFLLVAAAIVGVVWTREIEPPPDAEDQGQSQSSAQKQSQNPKPLLSRVKPPKTLPLVDQRPLQTAQHMAALAATPEEQALAHEAEKVGDHEVDLAFFDKLRSVEENPPALSPEVKQLDDRKNKAALALKEDQDNIAQLTRRLAAAPETQKDNLQDQIDVAKAQVDLDQDELDDASEDLEEAGGDPQSKIKRLKAEHDASEHNESQAGSAVNPHEHDYQTRTLLPVFRAWQALREKKINLEAARQETVTKQNGLAARHPKLAAQVAQEKESREAAKQQAKGFSKSSNAASREESKAAAKTALDSLKQYTRDQKNLADLGRRLQDEHALTDIYATWIALVETRERVALHNILIGVLWILLIVLAVYLSHRLIDRLFSKAAEENKRLGTLRSVIKFAVEAIGAVIILFVVFGMPTQTATILGFVGAGLTVALKDFIVPFFGWFVLMGSNGIRVGDWVEINGVGGEVIEIGLLRTVLMETGNWTDAGHPTGRKVAFPNSFAIEGHYFNLSTSGQWMWDELQLSIPSDKDPYAVIDGLQKLAAKETEANAQKAEQEWQGATTRYHVKAFSAEPAINVRPTGSGVEVRLRYITRAYERHETRKKLNEAVVELMHGKREAVTN
jgi:small-conductance mechanosensitive channel